MASNRRALTSSSGVSFGSMLAVATSSDSATNAAVFSWWAKDRGLKLRSLGLETGSDFKVFQIETTLLPYRCWVLVVVCVSLCMPHMLTVNNKWGAEGRLSPLLKDLDIQRLKWHNKSISYTYNYSKYDLKCQEQNNNFFLFLHQCFNTYYK